MKTPKVIGIIGPNKELCNSEIYHFGEELGRQLIDNGFRIVCGGKQGIMEAVCKGAHRSKNYTFGTTIGILPEDNDSQANKWCDIVIPSGIGISRNSIIINTCDVLIATAGGAGTLSEIAFAWQKGKPVFCVTSFDGWANKLAGEQIDQRHKNLLIPVSSIQEIMEKLEHF